MCVDNFLHQLRRKAANESMHRSAVLHLSCIHVTFLQGWGDNGFLRWRRKSISDASQPVKRYMAAIRYRICPSVL